MTKSILDGYSGTWVQLQLEIERKAHLHQLNMNWFHRTSIDENCLRRKEALKSTLEDNIANMAVWFTQEIRHEAYVFHGRRMYRQYQTTLIRLNAQIEYIRTWLDQSPPF